VTAPRPSRRPRRLRVWQAMALIGLVIAVAFWSRQGSTPAIRQEAGVLPRVLTGPVVQVVDGDTIDVQLDGHTIRVRYLGINTPETTHPDKGVEPFGPEADAANRRLVEGKTVRLELDVQPWDRYQRLLAYVYVGDLMVNAELAHPMCGITTASGPCSRRRERPNGACGGSRNVLEMDAGGPGISEPRPGGDDPLYHLSPRGELDNDLFPIP
jgi:endonuclease YncB( thermonuclease family)